MTETESAPNQFADLEKLAGVANPYYQASHLAGRTEIRPTERLFREAVAEVHHTRLILTIGWLALLPLCYFNWNPVVCGPILVAAAFASVLLFLVKSGTDEQKRRDIEVPLIVHRDGTIRYGGRIVRPAGLVACVQIRSKDRGPEEYTLVSVLLVTEGGEKLLLDEAPYFHGFEEPEGSRIGIWLAYELTRALGCPLHKDFDRA